MRSLAVFGFHAVVPEPLDVHDPCFVDVGTFYQQLLAIRSRYDVVPLSAGLRALRAEGDERCTRPMAALTFDDGFRSVCDVALPVLQELDVPASCFLSTAAIESGRPLWFCRLHRAITETRRTELSWAGRSWPLTSAPERSFASAALQALLKDAPGDRVDDETDELCRLLGVDPVEPGDAASAYRPMDPESVRSLARAGLIEFGAHGHRHMILSTIDTAAQQEEIETSVAAVRALTGQVADTFAYPNGARADFNEESVAALQRVGVTAALLAVGGVCTPASSVWALPRILLDGRSWEARV